MHTIIRSSTSPELDLERDTVPLSLRQILTSKALLKCLAESQAVENVSENHCKSSRVRLGFSEGRWAANSCMHFSSGSLIKRFRLLCNEHRCSCAKQSVSLQLWSLHNANSDTGIRQIKPLHFHE